MKRKDDSETQFYFCADRMFEENGKWYFNTREGITEGPFMDELEAKTWIELYVSMMCSDLLPIDGELSLESIRLDQAG